MSQMLKELLEDFACSVEAAGNSEQLIKITQKKILDAIQTPMQEAKDALEAFGVFHTPIAKRKLRGTDEWNEYETDAVARKDTALKSLEPWL